MKTWEITQDGAKRIVTLAQFRADMAARYWEFDGARHGSGYKTFEQALAHFERIPTIDPYAAYKTA